MMLEGLEVLHDGEFINAFAVRGEPSVVHYGEVWVGESVKHHEACSVGGTEYPSRESVLSLAYFDNEAEARAYEGVLRKGPLLTCDDSIPWRVSKVRDPIAPLGIPLTGGWCISVGSSTSETFVPIRSKEHAMTAFCRACERRASLPAGMMYFTRGDDNSLRFSAPGMGGEFPAARVQFIGDANEAPAP